MHTPKQENRANRVRRPVSFQAVLTPKASTTVTCPTALHVNIQMTKASVSVYHQYHPLLPIAFNEKPLLSRVINNRYYIYSYFSKCLKKFVATMCIKDWLHSWSMHNQLLLYLESYKLIVLYQKFWAPDQMADMNGQTHTTSVITAHLSALPKRTYNVRPNTFLCNHSNTLHCRQVKEQNQKQSVNPGQSGEMSPNTSVQVRLSFSSLWISVLHFKLFGLKRCSHWPVFFQKTRFVSN